MYASLKSTSRLQRRRLLMVVGVSTLAMALALFTKDTLNIWLTTGLASGFVLLLGFGVHGVALWRLFALSWRGAALGVGTGLLMAVLTKIFYPLGVVWMPQIPSAGPSSFIHSIEWRCGRCAIA